MGYYRYTSHQYRSWRSRSSRPSKYSLLENLFGDAVRGIQHAFLTLDKEALHELFDDYCSMYGESAEKYARKTYPNWKNGSTKLSGQTMERLVALVPPYLSAKQRFNLLQQVLKKNKPSTASKIIRINAREPEDGFTELQSALSSMQPKDILAHIPERVMQAATWLYDDDITAARAMVAEAERKENDIIRASAAREIALLEKTIRSGQVQSASYSVQMPVGTLSVVVYQPSSLSIFVNWLTKRK